MHYIKLTKSHSCLNWFRSFPYLIQSFLWLLARVNEFMNRFMNVPLKLILSYLLESSREQIWIESGVWISKLNWFSEGCDLIKDANLNWFISGATQVNCPNWIESWKYWIDSFSSFLLISCVVSLASINMGFISSFHKRSNFFS